MSRYFMRDTNLANTETAMMAPPLFKKRYSGIFITHRLDYAKEYCDQGCVWLAERLETPSATYSELMRECFCDIDNKSLHIRLRRLMAVFHGRLFKDTNHQHRFQYTINSIAFQLKKTSNYHVASLFLLTKKLWQLVSNSVTGDAICFKNIKLAGICTDGYALYQMAKMLSTGQAKITVSELADHELISDSLLAVMVWAVFIARFGNGVFSVEGIKI